MLPKKHVSKNYRAQVAGIMDEADVAHLKRIAPSRLHTLPATADLRGNEANDSLVNEIEIAKENSIRSSAWLLLVAGQWWI